MPEAHCLLIKQLRGGGGCEEEGEREGKRNRQQQPTAAAATAVPFPPKKNTGLQLLLHVTHLLSFGPLGLLLGENNMS